MGKYILQESYHHIIKSNGNYPASHCKFICLETVMIIHIWISLNWFKKYTWKFLYHKCPYICMGFFWNTLEKQPGNGNLYQWCNWKTIIKERFNTGISKIHPKITSKCVSNHVHNIYSSGCINSFKFKLKEIPDNVDEVNRESACTFQLKNFLNSNWDNTFACKHLFLSQLCKYYM